MNSFKFVVLPLKMSPENFEAWHRFSELVCCHHGHFVPSKSSRELKFICTPSSHLMYTWQRSSQIHLRDSQLRVIFRKAALDMRQYKQQIKKKLQSLCLKKSLQTILSKILPSAHHPQFMAAIPTKKTYGCFQK